MPMKQAPVVPTADDSRHWPTVQWKAPLLFGIFAFLIHFLTPNAAYSTDSYQALNQRFVGYSEEEIDSGLFEVHYSGQWKQSHELMGRYGLFRSAELAEELGFPMFSIDSFTLFDEPDVQIYTTCSDIRVVSNSMVPAALLYVYYQDPERTDNLSTVFSVAKLLQMRSLLLDENQKFNLYAFLESKGVQITDEREP